MEAHYFQDEPLTRWDAESLDRFLIWGEQLGMSDVHILPGGPFWIRLHGAWLPATRRRVAGNEIMELVNATYRSANASAQVQGGQDLDYAHEIRLDRVQRKRFRCNATACRDGWQLGASIVMRTIPALPPPLEDLDVEPAIMEAAFPVNGLVLVTGVMGTGKSTLLSSMLRYIRENQPRNILTYESPIEFDLMNIPNPKGPLVQASIPEHLVDFVRAPRNSARRAADVVLIGESRDPETLRGMIEMAEIGVAAYSTVHTRGVAETPTRIINVFPSNSQNQIASTLLASLRLIIQQRLVPKVGGGRIALREYLAFDVALREQLYREPITNLIPAIQMMVRECGQPLVVDARRKLEAGLIFEKDYRAIVHEQETSEEAIKHVA